MALALKEVRYAKFSTGLNVVDSTIDMQDSDLVTANNVVFLPSGEVQSINGLTQVGSDITVNSLPATHILGRVKFNGYIYIMASNGTNARLLYFDGSAWQQAVSTNFDASAKVEFAVYNSTLWFVNGQTTGSNVLNFLSTSNVLTGLTTSSGLEAGINHIALHLERMWISKGNKIFVSRQYPTAVDADWDAGTVYAGSNTAGLIQIDNNTEDAIVGLIEQFGQLVVGRNLRMNVVSGETILTSTIQKAFNARGILAPLSFVQANDKIFFLSKLGVDIFSGITVQQSTTQFDAVTTDHIDRRIRTLIESISDRSGYVGIFYKDKYYLSDAVTYTYVFDIITGGWSRFVSHQAEVFLDDGDTLYMGAINKFYKVNNSTSASVSSTVKTKDFNMGDDVFYKVFHSAQLTFRRLTDPFSITVKWYLDGATSYSGSFSVTVPQADAEWDSGYKWDSDGLHWDVVTINFYQIKQRHLRTGKTIAFSIEATGTNRFSLQGINVLFEQIRKGA